MKMKFKILIATAAALIAQIALAQTSIKVEAPNLVASDEQFNITFIVEGDNSPSNFSWDPGNDFSLVWGPQKGSSSSTSIINGKRTHSSMTTFTYVLMPKSAGTFRIPVATATVKGDQISSESVSIEVIASGSGSSSSRQSSGSNPSSRSSNSERSGSQSEINSDDLFLKLSVSRNSVVVGEPLTVTLKLYQRVNIAGFEDARFPDFNGFWSQELQAPTNIEFQRENLNDKIYNSALLRSWTLIPQQSGDLVIEPAELVCLVNVRSSFSTGNSIFDAFFQDDFQTIRKRITSPSQKIHVSALPAGAPSTFEGGVGSFNISASLSKDKLETHEAASLMVRISGKGNTALLEAPEINFPPDFEVYDVKTSVSGDTKTFEFPFIPRSHGDFTIPAIEYSFYDITARKYVTVSSGPLEISVAKGQGGNETTSVSYSSGMNRKGVKDLDTDIRFIKTGFPSLKGEGTFAFASGWFWILTCLLLAAGVAAYFVLKSALARRSDVALTKNRAATKMARRKLAVAGDLLGKNLYSAFYEEMHKALMGFASDKLTMDLADMSKENISASLQANGVSESVATQFVDLLDACEYARYSPDGGNEAMSAHYNSAVEVISAIDNRMKTRKNQSGRIAVALVIALILPATGATAQDDEYLTGLWTEGVEAYQNGNWEQALRSWTSIEDLGLNSDELFCNIGDAYFKSEDYAHAILYYERALKFNPSNSDARYNLDFANEFIQDDIDVIPELFISRIGRNICGIMSNTVWAWVWIIFLAISIALALVFFLSSSVRNRKLAFYSGIVTLLIALFALIFTKWQYDEYRSVHEAIVVRAVSSVQSSPSEGSSKDLFVLHEGTKVGIIDQVGQWLNIELSDGRQGWIRSEDIEEI